MTEFQEQIKEHYFDREGLRIYAKELVKRVFARDYLASGDSKIIDDVIREMQKEIDDLMGFEKS